MSETSRAHASPWRALFERVREAVGTRRDEHGVAGSINWLRRQMEARGANPNVVRNIIYRDKGKLADKRVLYEILSDLWSTAESEPLHAPEIEVLLSPHASAEQEVLQLLGREKRKAFRAFVRGVREGDRPKLLVTGRPGSGKTMLTDYIQQALQVPPAAEVRIVRSEFGSSDLGTTLGQLGERLGIERDALDARLTRIADAGAFAVQADAQAELARTLIDALKTDEPPTVLLLHVSQQLAQQETLGTVPLRLNTPEVPRLSAPEWLWSTLLEPLSRLAGVSVLVSMTDLPARALQNTSGFGLPIKLTPPTAGEARRFVKARLPHLSAAHQEAIVQRAGRSFEELRTLTLLAEIRAPLPDEDTSDASVARLSELVSHATDSRVRDFLAALATVSLPAFPTFRMDDLAALRPSDHRQPSELERAFVDPVPGGEEDEVRCFSRRLVRALRSRLLAHDPERFRALHAASAERLANDAADEPNGDRAARYVEHLYEARDWGALVDWMRKRGAPPALVRRAWGTATRDLAPVDTDAFERLAEQVAAHYVKLGAYRHPDALAAFEILTHATDEQRRAWSLLKQAEGAVLRNDHDAAQRLLEAWPKRSDDALLAADEALVRASIARWRGELASAARIVEEEARPHLATLEPTDAAVRLVLAKAAVWAGLIAKDRGDLETAAREFDVALVDDDLVRARLAFQSGDVALTLGRLGAARDAFDEAVERSQRSGALGYERARYLARRGTLRLRVGDDAGARLDHDEADSLLRSSDDGVDVGFWRARVDVERSEALLASGRHDAAIELLDAAAARFRAFGEARGVDAEYRIDRTTLRLGTAYLARASGEAWRPPFPAAPFCTPASADARHGLAMLERVADRVPDGTEEAQVPDGLARKALLISSLAAERNAAERNVERASRLIRCRHDDAETSVFRAAVALRGDDGAAASDALQRARSVLSAVEDRVGDPGLLAWLELLDGQAAIALGDANRFVATLTRCTREELPGSLRERVLRGLGHAAERHGHDAWLDRPGVPAALSGAGDDTGPLRLGDRLVRRWRSAQAAEAVPVESRA